MIDRYQDTKGRIPKIGDRVRVQARPYTLVDVETLAPAYWGRLAGLTEHRAHGLICHVLDERGANRAAPSEYVVRARDTQQDAITEHDRLSNELKVLCLPKERRR